MQNAGVLQALAAKTAVKKSRKKLRENKRLCWKWHGIR